MAGGVQREAALDTGAEADLADHEGLTNAAALTSDHHAGESLQTGVVAFLDLHVDFNGVTRTECRDFLSGFRCLASNASIALTIVFPRVAAAYRRTGKGFVRRSCDCRLGLFFRSAGLPAKGCRSAGNIAIAHVRSYLRTFRLDLKKSGIMRRPAFRHSNNQNYPIRKTRMGHLVQPHVTRLYARRS